MFKSYKYWLVRLEKATYTLRKDNEREFKGTFTIYRNFGAENLRIIIFGLSLQICP